MKLEIFEKSNIYRELGEDLLDTLNIENREFVQRVFGIFPYQPHSIRELAKIYRIAHSSAYWKYRKILRLLKKEILKSSLKLDS